MVAMGIFLLVGASVFVLFSQQQNSASQQQGLVGLNIGIRNVMAQLQLDLANAGTGYYVGPNVPSYPIGVTIVNNVPAPGTSCYNSTTSTYTATCFDQLNVLTAANSTTPPAPINVTDQYGGTSGTSSCSHTSYGVAYGQAAVNPDGSPLTLGQTAANYKQGDQLLFLNGKGSKMTAVKLTQAPTPYPPNQPVAVQFTFNPTNTDGTNAGPNWQTNDPLGIASCGGVTCPNLFPSGQPSNCGGQTYCQTGTVGPPFLSEQYCYGDWILKVNPISYSVDSSNPNDPQLIRKQGGNTVVVMDQVIGFKVGATIWNSAVTEKTEYVYDASTYTLNNPGDSSYMFSLVRSVRVSLIGRTNPNLEPSFTFRNPFDGGPYLVQGASVVVDPRNLSMND
jgi:type II secretory pathway pseudopilin PulG